MRQEIKEIIKAVAKLIPDAILISLFAIWCFKTIQSNDIKEIVRSGFISVILCFVEVVRIYFRKE